MHPALLPTLEDLADESEEETTEGKQKGTDHEYADQYDEIASRGWQDEEFAEHSKCGRGICSTVAEASASLDGAASPRARGFLPRTVNLSAIHLREASSLGSLVGRIRATIPSSREKGASLTACERTLASVQRQKRKRRVPKDSSKVNPHAQSLASPGPTRPTRPTRRPILCAAAATRSSCRRIASTTARRRWRASSHSAFSSRR